jgi:hypothetical protein
MKKFEELAELSPEGNQPFALSILDEILNIVFDGNIETDHMVDCHIDGDVCKCTVFDEADRQIDFTIGRDWNIDMFIDTMPTHYNQWIAYEMLIHEGFIRHEVKK